MINFKNRSGEKEILDHGNIPFADIALNMQELEWINSHLGGHAVTLSGFKWLLREEKEISVCEIGCGGGDNLKAIHYWCIRNHIKAKFTGIDINRNCISFAQENAAMTRATFIVSDYKKVNFGTDKPDIIFSSLFCHHFTNDELIEMIHWMKKNSGTGFFVNDLHRHPIAYHFIKAATKLLSKSYLVQHDAPVSVLRGFKKHEWESTFKQAGIYNYRICWKWAFRHLISVSGPTQLNHV